MANRNQDNQSDRNRPYGGRDENYDEGDSSSRAGNYDQGRHRYGRDTEDQSGSTGRYAGYGNFGQGDYDRTGRGQNTGQNRYGMTGYGGGDRDQGYGQGNYGQPNYGGQSGSDQGQGRSNQGSGRYDREQQDYQRGGSDWNQRQGGGADFGRGAQYGGSQSGQHAGSGQSSGYAGPGYGYGGSGTSQSGGSQSGQGQGLHRGKGPKGYQRSDERLKEMISERLREDPHIDASEVTVTCQGGKITLEGTVDSRQTKNAIEDVAEQMGVEDVQNNLRIQRGGGESMGSENSLTGGTSRSASGTDKDKNDLTRQRH